MSIQVSVRVRPILPRIDGRTGEVLQFDEEDSTVQLVSDVPNPGQLKSYRFDHLIGPEQTTGQLYDKLVRSAVGRLRHGYNLALFAYGPSGAGKTHTMTGDAHSPGITSLAFRQIFAHRCPGDRCTVRVSVMEIYQDTVYDLLNERSKVQLKGSGVGGILRFQGLREQSVHSADEAVRAVESGLAARTKATTYVHEHSNRSHTVVRVLLETADESISAGSELLVASLFLVDLAGSETVSDQQTQTAQSEGKSITRSLFHLRRCIHALAAGRRPEYRSSKLTRLLEPAIAQGSISIICNVSQRVMSQRQAVDCLEFGKQAAMVQLAPPTQNVATASAASNVEEVRALKRQLNASKSTQTALEAELRELRCAFSVREANRQRETEEQLLQLRCKLRQEMAEKAQATELLRAAEEQNQSLHSQLLGLDDSLSISQTGCPSATAVVSFPWSWRDSALAESRPLATDPLNRGTKGRENASSASEAKINPCSPSSDKPQQATHTQLYPACPAGPDDARKAFGDAQTAERKGETRQALDLYQRGLRLLMKHVQHVPSDQSALQPHVQAFFDNAFAARERLKHHPVAAGTDVPVTAPKSNVTALTSSKAGWAVNGNDGRSTPEGSAYAHAILVQAQAAEESGEYKLALALLQEGIRTTLADLKVHPDRQAGLNPMLESLFQRAYAVRQLLAGAQTKTTSLSPPQLSGSELAEREKDKDDTGLLSFSSDELFESNGSRWRLCRAVYTFRPISQGDLGFASGDLIAVDEQASSSWVTGRRVTTSPGKGLQLLRPGGALPTKYVEMALYRMCCVANFESEEPDEVDLRQGESFFVVAEPDSEPEWVKGFALPLVADLNHQHHQMGSRYGLVPKNFLGSPKTR